MSQRAFAKLKPRIRLANIAIEIRYPKAHRYWDISGQLIDTLESNLQLECLRLDDNGFLFNGKQGSAITTAQFYWNKAVTTFVDLDASSYPAEFDAATLKFQTAVLAAFDVTTLTRIGHRVIHYMPFTTSEAATAFVKEHSAFEVQTSVLSAWGRPSSEGLKVRFNLDGDRTVDVRLGSGKIEAQGDARHAAIIDTDFFLGEMPKTHLDLRSFLDANREQLSAHAAKLYDVG